MDRVDYQPLLVQDVVNLYHSGELDYSPWYQRRSTWTTPQKAYLINTLHENKPIPAVYIRYSLDLEAGKTVREVVDGQQRIRALLEYYQDGFSALHPPSAEKKSFAQLSTRQKERFLLTAIPVGYLLGATDEDVIDIFGRINSVSKTLNPQEKRNAAFSGEFKQFSLTQASSRINFWRNYNLFTANDIARMQEVQFVSDLSMNMLEGLSDFSPKALDNYYAKYEEDFPEKESVAQRLDRVFDFLIDLNSSSLKDTVFRRQPLFFSLFLVLDAMAGLKAENIEQGLLEMDARFNDEGLQTPKDKDFVAASTSTTQRIRQRRIRDKYIRGFIG